MKKSMLALAVLAAFAGAASAQSSVTLYGRAETNVTYSKPGDAIGGGNEVWKLNDGGANSGVGGSRWGLRGSEDLGGGLKAYFILESGFNLDTGGQTNANLSGGGSTAFFNRQAYVALGSASLGDVRLGRQESISRLINSGYSDASNIGELKIDETILGSTAVASATGGTTAGVNSRQLFQTFGQRVDNVVSYTTPSFGGFKAAAYVGAGEGANARYQGLMAAYNGGPIAVAVGYEEYDKFGARTGTYNKVLNVGGNYNFGFMQLFAGYQDAKDVGSNSGGTVSLGASTVTVKDEQAYTVGVMVPVGLLQIRANYTKADYDLSNGTSADATKYGASVRYALSKRTSLYSAVTQRDGKNPGTGLAADADRSFLQKREITLLGVYHTF